MTQADIYQDDTTGAAMIRMRPMDWEEAHKEQVYTHCPKEFTGSSVSVANFCATCPHFKGLAVPSVGRLMARLNRKEITEESFQQLSAQELQRAGAVSVVCAYPNLLQCGSFKAVKDNACSDSG